MAREAMTVLCWKPVRNQGSGGRAGTGDARPGKLHVSRDGLTTVDGLDVPQDAIVVAATPDWHKHATCYNCVYRLWPDHAPEGYVRPVDGQDFPLRRECPHAPGRGRDPRSCAACTPGQGQPLCDQLLFRPRARVASPGGNPDPAVIRKWHIPSPYRAEPCVVCGQDIEPGELINIEYEAGVIHASCSGYDDG